MRRNDKTLALITPRNFSVQRNLIHVRFCQAINLSAMSAVGAIAADAFAPLNFRYGWKADVYQGDY